MNQRAKKLSSCNNDGNGRGGAKSKKVSIELRQKKEWNDTYEQKEKRKVSKEGFSFALAMSKIGLKYRFVPTNRRKLHIESETKELCHKSIKAKCMRWLVVWLFWISDCGDDGV